MDDRIAPTPEILGKILADARKARGLTQAQLARRMGTRQATISKLETNPRDSRLDTIFRALAALELDMNIARRTEHPETPW